MEVLLLPRQGTWDWPVLDLHYAGTVRQQSEQRYRFRYRYRYVCMWVTLEIFCCGGPGGGGQAQSGLYCCTCGANSPSAPASLAASDSGFSQSSTIACLSTIPTSGGTRSVWSLCPAASLLCSARLDPQLRHWLIIVSISGHHDEYWVNYWLYELLTCIRCDRDR